MRWRYLLYLLLFAAAIAMQWPLWFGSGGVLRSRALEAELASINAANERQRADNDRVAAEIESLRDGLGAVEERARMRLGMIRDDELLFRLIPEGQKAAPGERPAAADSSRSSGQAGRKVFTPRRSDLYIPGAAAPAADSKPAPAR